MRDSIYNILSKIENYSSTKERVEYLKSIDHPVIRSIFKYMFMPELKFSLPEGIPPYKPFDFDEPGRLWGEARKFYLFVESQSPNLTKVRREQLFINFIEGIYEDDAKIVLAIKDQKPPFKGITRKVVEKAYAGIFT